MNLNAPPMLDVILKQYLKIHFVNNLTCSKETFPPALNWKALSKSVPNTTPEICQKRFYQLNAAIKRASQELGVAGCFSPDEILSSSDIGDSKLLHNYVRSLISEQTNGTSNNKQRMILKSNVSSSDSEFKDSEYSKQDSESQRLGTATPPSPISTADSKTKTKGGPSMVIHVCDEAKNLRQDFTCPRDLLIQEMKYFAEYLSVDSQRLEEVDISVHCDIHIFDWLMRYVKRNTGLINQDEVPKLEPSNVISILISSDFLKMEVLVEECIGYCHQNLSSIVATPCNMNCVNDRLTQLISSRFSHNDLEDVKDRKDKFKSKLFCKKIEKLFQANAGSSDSIGNGSTLFRCKACHRVLTHEQQNKLPCVNDRMKINRSGGLMYEHEVDKTWDVTTFIINLHDELKKWSYVYWRLWGIVNHLTCSRCNVTFQLIEFGHCQYHPERALFRQFENNEVSSDPIGRYLCCNQRVLRFDPTGLNKGCKVRDHIVTTSDVMEQRLLDDAILHKSLVQTPYVVSNVSSNLNMFGDEEAACGVTEPTYTPAEIIAPPAPAPKPVQITTTKVARTVSLSDNYYTGLADNSEEDSETEEITEKPRVPSSTQMSLGVPPFPLASPRSQAPAPSAQTTVINTTKMASPKKGKDKSHLIDKTVYGKFPNKQRWEANRSIRWNQDVQREEDMRRLQEMTMQLAKQRLADKTDKNKAKVNEYPGGIFSKLEANFFSNLKISTSHTGIFVNKQGGNANRDRPPRPRQTQVRF